MTALSMMLGLAENNAWANHRLYTACAALTEDERRAKRTSFFPSIHATLVHSAIVDAYYLDALTGGGRGRAIWDDEARLDPFDVLRASQAASDRALVAFVAGLHGEDARAPNARDALDVSVAMERADHVQREKRGDVLLHLFQHQIHHRGQAHAMLAGTRVAPPQLDEFFMSEELPLREAELRTLGLRIR
jgi:uncharacterized damage-inducible protein DinB